MIKLQDLIKEVSISDIIDAGRVYFIPFRGRPSESGWKLSLQGKTTDDAKELYKLLGSWLNSNNVAYKIGTSKLINQTQRKEQQTKLLTIYVPDDEDLMDFAEKVYKKVKRYKGWYNIKTPTSYKHYAGAVFYRNDRDSSGKYIPAKK